MNPLTKLVILGACYVSVAAVAQVAPYGDALRDGGFVCVLVAIGRMFLRHLAKRDQQVEDARDAFLTAQGELVKMSREAIAAAERTCAVCGEEIHRC